MARKDEGPLLPSESQAVRSGRRLDSEGRRRSGASGQRVRCLECGGTHARGSGCKVFVPYAYDKQPQTPLEAACALCGYRHDPKGECLVPRAVPASVVVKVHRAIRRKERHTLTDVDRAKVTTEDRRRGGLTRARNRA